MRIIAAKAFERDISYSIVGALVHVYALVAGRGRVQVKVEPPKRGAKRVGQARLALKIQRVGLAKYERRLALARSHNSLVLLSLLIDVARGAGVVHECVLQSHTRRRGAVNVATVKSVDEIPTIGATIMPILVHRVGFDAIVLVQSQVPDIHCLERLDAIVVRRRHKLQMSRLQVRAVLAHLSAYLGRAIQPLPHVVLGAPARRARRVLAAKIEVVGLVAVLVAVEAIAAKRLARQRRRVDERLPAFRRDGALGNVEAVRELDAGEGLVGLRKKTDRGRWWLGSRWSAAGRRCR